LGILSQAKFTAKMTQNQFDKNAEQVATASVIEKAEKITTATSFGERFAGVAGKANLFRYIFQALDGIIVAVGVFVLLHATLGSLFWSIFLACAISVGVEVLIGAFLPLAIRHLVQGWAWQSWRYVPTFLITLFLAVSGCFGAWFFSVKATPEIVKVIRGAFTPPTHTPDSVATQFWDEQIKIKTAAIDGISHLSDGSDWVVTNKTSPTLHKDLALLVAKRDSTLSDNHKSNDRLTSNHQEGSEVISDGVSRLGAIFLIASIILVVFWEYYAIQSQKEKPDWLAKLAGANITPTPTQPVITSPIRVVKRHKARLKVVPHTKQVVQEETAETPDAHGETEEETVNHNARVAQTLKKYVRTYHERSISSKSPEAKEANRQKAAQEVAKLEAIGWFVELSDDGSVHFRSPEE
jgi:hypothetical protein